MLQKSNQQLEDIKNRLRASNQELDNSRNQLQIKNQHFEEVQYQERLSNQRLDEVKTQLENSASQLSYTTGQLQNANVLLEKLKTELAESKKRQGDIEGQLKGANARVEELMSLCDEFQNQLASRDLEARTLKDSIRMKDTIIMNKDDEILVLNSELRDKTADASNLRDQLNEERKKYAVLEEAIREFQEREETHQIQTKHRIDQIAKLEEIVEMQKDSINDGKLQAQKNGERISTLERLNVDLNLRIEELSQSLQSLRKEKAEADRMLKEMQEKISTLSHNHLQEIHELETKVESSKESIAEKERYIKLILADSESLKAQNQSLSEAKRDLESKLRASNTELSGTKHELESKTYQVSTYTAQVSTLRVSLDAALGKCTDLEKQIVSLQESIINHQIKLESEALEKKALNEKCRSLQRELASQRQLLDTETELSSGLSIDLITYKKLAEEGKEQSHFLQNEVIALKKSLSEANQLNHHAEQRHKEEKQKLLSENDSLVRQIKGLNLQVEKMNQEIEKRGNLIAQLRKELEGLQIQYKENIERLSKSSRQVDEMKRDNEGLQREKELSLKLMEEEIRNLRMAQKEALSLEKSGFEKTEQEYRQMIQSLRATISILKESFVKSLFEVSQVMTVLFEYKPEYLFDDGSKLETRLKQVRAYLETTSIESKDDLAIWKSAQRISVVVDDLLSSFRHARKTMEHDMVSKQSYLSLQTSMTIMERDWHDKEQRFTTKIAQLHTVIDNITEYVSELIEKEEKDKQEADGLAKSVKSGIDVVCAALYHNPQLALRPKDLINSAFWSHRSQNAGAYMPIGSDGNHNSGRASTGLGSGRNAEAGSDLHATSDIEMFLVNGFQTIQRQLDSVERANTKEPR